MSTEQLIIALIGGFFVLNAAVITTSGVLMGKAIGRVRTDVRAVEYQVTPNKGLSAHDAVIARIEGVETQVRNAREEIGEGREDTRLLRTEVRQIQTDQQAALRQHVANYHT